MTRPEAAVLEAILAFKVVHTYPPTVRELAEVCGFSSPSTVQHHLDSLEDKGYITRSPTKPRTIVVTPEETDASPADVPQPHPG